MAFETINLGTQPAGTGGDTARSAFEKVNKNFMTTEVLASAMSQAQFDVIRTQNNEEYAASGFVHFGNHESSKQVNEVKSGLYTSLTTPNTLLIGKVSGVGGSKTDYAVIHIDGVVFKLTPSFVMPLPNAPALSSLSDRMDMYGFESDKVEISILQPSLYPQGLKGVSTPLNFFALTDSQKKTALAENSNTTFFAPDGKLYQYQVYAISFAGTTSGEPSPVDQGYVKNSLGDLFTKGSKKLLYFGNALRLNTGGYHPSFNPLGTAKFSGDTYWYNTSATITSKSDCFNPAKLLAGSGSISSGKSGNPDGRYFDAIYSSGQGGVCRDMRYSANHTTLEDFDEADLKVKNGTCRGFEFLSTVSALFSNMTPVAVSSWLKFRSADIVGDTDVFSTDSTLTGDYGYIVDSLGTSYKIEAVYRTGAEIWLKSHNVPSWPDNRTWSGAVGVPKKVSVGGSFLQTDVIGDPANILLTDALKNGWEGSWIPVIPDGIVVYRNITHTRKGLLTTMLAVFASSPYTTWGQGDFTIDGALNGLDSGGAPTVRQVRIHQYQAFAKQTEPTVNSAVYGGARGTGSVDTMSQYNVSRSVFLGESLLGLIGKNQGYPYGANSTVLSRVLFDSKFVSGAYAPTHEKIILGAPTNDSKAFKALNYNTETNQQAGINYAATELVYGKNTYLGTVTQASTNYIVGGVYKVVEAGSGAFGSYVKCIIARASAYGWSGIFIDADGRVIDSNGDVSANFKLWHGKADGWGDDSQIHIVDNENTLTDLNGTTVKVVTHKLKEPIGWIKNTI
jgi:hypothetical protein